MSIQRAVLSSGTSGTPADGSVTDAKVAANAAISADKVADGTTNKVMTAAERTKVAGLATIATSGSATDLSTGTVPPARLGTGTASSSTFLRGDGAWATTPAGGSGAAQFFNVKDYGALGTGAGDDSAAVQSAIDAAASAGGGTVSFPSGTYRMLTGLTVANGVHLLGAGQVASKLDFSAMTAPSNQAAIYAGGSLTALPAFSSSIAKNATSITFATAPSLSPRDVVIIYNSANNSYSTARTYYRAGEMVRVLSVSTNTANLSTRTFAAYASGGTVSAYRMNSVTVSISRLSATFKAGSNGITIRHGVGCVLSELNLTGSNWSNIEIDRCYETTLAYVRVADYSANITLNYGASLDNSQRVAVLGGFYETTRHGVTTGSGDLTGGIPCREMFVQGATVSSLPVNSTSGENGMDFHGNAERVRLENCHFPNGINVAGDEVTIIGCDIRGGGSGVAIYAGEVLGLSWYIANNNIEATNTISDNRGLVNFPLGTVMTRTEGTFRFVDNHLDMGSYSATTPSSGTYGLYLSNDTSTANNNDVYIHGNTVNTTVATANPYYGLAVWGDTSVGFRSVSIKNNVLRRCGIWVRDLNPDDITISDNEVFDALDRGIYFRSTVTPIFTNGIVTVARNKVSRSKNCGMYLDISDTTATARVIDNLSINNNQVGGTGSTDTDSSMFLTNAKEAIVEGNVFGDNQATPTQNRVYSVDTITRLFERNNHNVGTSTTINSTSITNEYDGFDNQARTRQAHGTAAPTTGTWVQGDIVWHSAPVTTGNIGWVCTSGGTPGTWKTFGTIA